MIPRTILRSPVSQERRASHGPMGVENYKVKRKAVSALSSWTMSYYMLQPFAPVEIFLVLACGTNSVVWHVALPDCAPTCSCSRHQLPLCMSAPAPLHRRSQEPHFYAELSRPWQELWTYSKVASCTSTTEAECNRCSKQYSESVKSTAQPNNGPRNERLRSLALMIMILAGAVAINLGLVALMALDKQAETHDDSAILPDTRFSSPSKTNDKPHLCGISSSQARELGCTFNQLMWA